MHGQEVEEPVESAVLHSELHVPAAFAAVSHPSQVEYGLVTWVVSGSAGA